MKVAVGLRRVAAGKRTSGRRAAQIAQIKLFCKVKLKGRNFKEYASNKYIGKTWAVRSVKN